LGGAIQIAREFVRPYYLKFLYSRLFRARYPSYFKACWSFPSWRIDKVPRDVLGGSPARRDFVFLPMVDWHMRMQRTPHLARTLSRMGHRCFYASIHLGRQFPQPYPFSDRRVIARLAESLFEVHVHLPREPVFHQRRLTAPEVETIVSALADLLDQAGSEAPVLVVSFPLWTEVAERLRDRFGATVVYDCHDLLEGFTNISPDLIENEASLMASSDLVAFSSDWLKRRFTEGDASLQSKSFLLRNAVDLDDFDMAPAPERKSIGPKEIGYAGSLNFWLDKEFISDAARAHPDWNFHLFGRVETDISEWADDPNIHCEGELPYAELSGRLASMDALIMPFKICPLTLATNPVKLYEYLASGIPVVSTRLPEVELFADLVYLAETAGDFTRQLEKAMAEDDPAVASRRRAAAQRETWQKRCVGLVEQVETHDRHRITAVVAGG
jgi:glycosyltransferase involved in cell wall biosynthesis